MGAETINYECRLAFMMGVPVGYLLNRVPQKFSRAGYMIAVAFISTSIVLTLDLLAVVVVSGFSYLQDIDWLLTARFFAQDFLACLVIGSIMWKNRGPPEKKEVYVS